MKPDSQFNISLEELTSLNDQKDTDKLLSLGGVGGLGEALKTDLHHGLLTNDPNSSYSVQQHAFTYGENRFKQVPSKSFFSLLLEQLKDPIIILLMVAALFSTVLGVALVEQREEQGYVEGIAIWVAVIIVSFVGAGNDYQKDLQFRKLNAVRDLIQVKAIRDGQSVVVVNEEIVVGDILLLDAGDKIVADGVFVEGFNLTIDQANLTGESEPVLKGEGHDLWCRSGTQVTEGSGKIMVTAVGEHSEWGQTMAMVVKESDDTPLQEKLGFLAGVIGKVGMAVAVVAFLVLMIQWMIDNEGFPIQQINDDGPIQFFLYAVTIVVVAVPEGLPLAVTISLAYSMRKMMKDNNFVRVLAACETMGGATAICSDKTGTLTENQMTVVEGYISGTHYVNAPTASQIPQNVVNQLQMNISLNSKAFIVESKEKGGRPEFVGNRTECALLMWIRSWQCSYSELRDQYQPDIRVVYDFSSVKKMASVLVDMKNGTLRLYNKGAAEMVIQQTTRLHHTNGAVVNLNQQIKSNLLDLVTQMASRGLRVLAIAYTDFSAQDASRPSDFFDQSPDENLILIGFVGIKDPIRKEVPEAVETCRRAGITVRMVTGDNIFTAGHIARECGILTEEGEALEGPNFRLMTDEEILQRLPKLQVLARSAPNDKHKLVNLLKKQREVVAVTGDGTNDAPALKEADVGLAMGITGTEVAKEAADIVILDDNFQSIVKAVLWGRNVFNNIRKFLQFQLTINLVALIVAFIGAFVRKEPLNVLQLLWVNLIMDTLAALALATEDPNPNLLNHKPHGRHESLITATMWKHIIIQSIYQVFWVLLLMFGLPETDFKGGLYHIDSDCKVLQEWYSSGGCGSFPYNDCTENTFYGSLVQDYTTIQECSKIVEPNYSEVCALSNIANCEAKYKHFWSQWEDHLEEVHEEQERESLSVVFNAFIFMQVFNELNARKIRDEYNILDGIMHSPIFLIVMVVILALQILIMTTPAGQIFKVNTLTWEEWLITVAIGFGTIPLSLLIRFISRQLCQLQDDSINQNNVHTQKELQMPPYNQNGHFIAEKPNHPASTSLTLAHTN